MTTTKLGDFTEDQLALIGKMLIWKQMDIKDHVKGYHQFPQLASMFSEDIARWEAEIKELDTLITQFVHAANEKKMQRLALSN